MAEPEGHPGHGSPSGVRRATVLTMAAHGTVLVALAALLVIVVPMYEEMYGDARLTLPARTKAAVHASGLARQYGFLLLPALLGADAGVFVLLRAHRGTRALSVVWSLAVLGALLLYAVLTILALRLPFLPRYPT